MADGGDGEREQREGTVPSAWKQRRSDVQGVRERESGLVADSVGGGKGR